MSYYFVVLVLHEVEKLEDVLAAWEEAGVSGVTIVVSSGLGRIRTKAILREDLPLIPSLNSLLDGQHEELLNRTMFTICEGDALVDRIVEATERVLGDMSKPRNGIIAVMPIARVHGLRGPWHPDEGDAVGHA